MFIRNAASLMLAAITLAGCRRDDVKVYHVAKDDSAEPPPAQITEPEQISMAQPQQPQPQWTLPNGWQEIPPSQMRVASFTVTGSNGETADVGIIPLPAGENEIDLVNMWRDQLQLPAATNDTAEAVAIGSDSGKLFDIASDALLIDGKFRARILVAMLTSGGTSWFFKMTGEDSFVASQTESFLQFLKSVSFAQNSPAQIAAAPASQNESAGSIWTIPSGWQQLPPSEFLVAKFSIADADGAAAQVNVSSLAGDGGGQLANLNRWRGQLGLEPVTSGIPPVIVGPPGAAIIASGTVTVDYVGTDSRTGKPARLVGSIVPQNGQTWFYKLMGDPDIVARQKDAFIQFVQSAKYPNAP
jgi:hypothetical protein